MPPPRGLVMYIDGLQINSDMCFVSIYSKRRAKENNGPKSGDKGLYTAVIDEGLPETPVGINRAKYIKTG